MCKKLCPTCSCVDKIPSIEPAYPPKHFLYIECKMVDGLLFRIYGPHVYRKTNNQIGLLNDPLGGWYPTDIPANNVLDNAIEVIYVE